MKSHLCLSKYNLTPSVVHSAAVNYFSLDPKYLPAFSNYFILYWSASHTTSQISAGTILKDKIPYLAVFCKNSSRGKLKANPSSQVALSFRNPQPEFGLPAYVLIQLMEPK